MNVIDEDFEINRLHVLSELNHVEPLAKCPVQESEEHGCPACIGTTKWEVYPLICRPWYEEEIERARNKS